MMRGGTIATTFFFSVVILKMKAEKHHALGSGLAFLGILLVGLSDLVFSSTATSDISAVIET